MIETAISVVSSKALLTLFGACDQHLRRIRDALGVSISAHDGRIHIEGEPSSGGLGHRSARTAAGIAPSGKGTLAADDVTAVLAGVQNGDAPSAHAAPIEVFKAGRQIRPTNARPGPLRRGHPPATTSCSATGRPAPARPIWPWPWPSPALKREQVRKIVLVRPAVEAGESLGFLPGDLQAKINPYLRPLMDALREMMDHDLIKRYTEEDLIEVIPLAYMRGRTLNEAFIILDEAQNTTVVADEDVPDADGHGLEDRRLGRHHADRPAAARRAAG